MFNKNYWYHIFFLAGIVVLTSLVSCKKEINYTKKEKPEVIIFAGDYRILNNDVHFVKDTVYVLATNLFIKNGQVLTLDAGTLIKVRDKILIQITAGGKIESNGTKEAPVIFTSASLKGSPGLVVASNVTDRLSYWYGISVYGSSGVSSGNINYTRIEFAGGYRGTAGEGSLALYTVDKLTGLQNIQVSYSFQTPSFNLQGGNANASNLVSYASSATDFILEGGYKGMLQQLIAYRHPFFAPFCNENCFGDDLAGIVIKDNNTFPVISNLTVLGPLNQSGTTKKYFDTSFTAPFSNSGRVAALLLRNGGKFYMRNCVIAGFPKTGFHIDNGISARSLNFDESEFSSSVVQCNDTSRTFYLTPRIYPPNTSADFKQFILRPVYKNRQINSFDALGFTNPFDYDVAPNPLPKTGSPLLTGASFDGTIFSNSFFKPVPHVGALGSDDWMAGWVNFLPLQTDYNN